MKTQIQELLNQHKLRKDECFDLLEGLSGIDGYSLLNKDREALETSIIELSKELELRTSFIFELENLLS